MAISIAVLCLCSCNKKKILGKNEVATIMYEMFLADQYAKTYTEIGSAADSVLLYQHVFEKHSCTLQDYQEALRHYLPDQKAYSYILKRATLIAKDSSTQANKALEMVKQIKLYFPVPFLVSDELFDHNHWWTKTIDGQDIPDTKFIYLVRQTETVAPQRQEINLLSGTPQTNIEIEAESNNNQL